MNNEGNNNHVATEMFLGLNDSFTYIECSQCGSLSIMEIPDHMELYYPETYYSFNDRPYSRILGYLKGRRDRYYLDKINIIGYLASFRSSPPKYIEWIRNIGLQQGSSILDVGCGAGMQVINLYDAGFDAVGIDPFIAASKVHTNGARVLRQTLSETTGSFDCIMMHHSLEHMPDPHEVFSHLNRLLRPAGSLLVRVPVTGTYAWRTYGTNWFQLDAPRHLILYTESALCALAEKNGFQIRKIVYDSTASQFWGSEQYIRGIAHTSTDSYDVAPEKSIFSPQEIQEFTNRANELNDRNDGDQAAFYFTKVSSIE